MSPRRRLPRQPIERAGDESARNSSTILTPTPNPIRIKPDADGKIHCPFHDDSTPSLHVYADHWHCYGCGAHGDFVDWLMMVGGLDRDAAVDTLKRCNGSIAAHIARPNNNEDAGRTLASALRIWEAAVPIAGTPAVCYLAEVRGIDVDSIPDAALRFHPHCPFGAGVFVPCLIALFRDVATDAPAGIHRIRLTPDVGEGAKVERRSLGRWPTPRAIKLWPATGDQLYVGEGIEIDARRRDAPAIPRPADAPGLGRRLDHRTRQAAADPRHRARDDSGRSRSQWRRTSGRGALRRTLEPGRPYRNQAHSQTTRN